MNTKELAQIIVESTYSLYCYDHGELYSMGTAFSICEDGTLVTADHVISNGKELSDDEILNKKIQIYGRDSKGSIFAYKPIIYNLGFSLKEYIKGKITIDVAILKPICKITNASFLSISNRKLELGEDVAIAGFPEDVVFPEHILNRLIQEKIIGFSDKETMHKQIEVFNRFLIIKKCIVSKIFPIELNGTYKGKEITVEYEYFYFDSVLHKGASGGPVINKEGELVGIIIERAIIKQYINNYTDTIEIPSGMGLAISANTILSFYSTSPSMAQSSISNMPEKTST